jgi:hypothetical protein
MPAISAVPFNTLPAVRVMINWADTPGASNAAVFRIDCETGEEQMLRPYVSYNEDGYIALSCGEAVFWDTEVPLDRCVRYCTRAQSALGATITTPAGPIATDDFTRNVANGWGTATSGQTWAVGAGAAADFLVNGAKGFQTLPAVNAIHIMLLPLGQVATGILAKVNVSAMATGGNLTARLALAQDINNYYGTFVSFTPAGAVNIQLNKNIGGTGAALGGSATAGTYAAGTQFYVRFEQVPGGMPRAKAWLISDPEPDWQVIAPSNEAEITNLVQGALLSRSEVGNTNVNPIVAFDDMVIYSTCGPTVTVESCGPDLIVPSSGYNMLRDPMRPCNDLHVGLCWPSDPECRPGRGVYFARLEGEAYAANSQTQQAFNAARPATASRERSDAASTLVLVSRTFTDRDAVVDILRAGTPLLWQTAPEYGQPDRYIQVGDAVVTRYHPDHRYQPRTITLPFYTVDRPEGPAQGICGARVKDLCDIYSSWGAMASAGLTYEDLLLGFASPSGPPDPNRRHWIDVENGFANWLGVETAPNTWKTLRDGE